MSIKEEISSLKEANVTLQKSKERVQLDLNGLQAEEQRCQRRAEELAGKKSALAQKLIEENNSNLEAISRVITEKQKEVEDLESELKENQSKIAQMEENSIAYVQEQAQRMVPELIQYIGEHLEEIGSLIKKAFIIKDVGCLVEDRYGNYIVYTGQIGVYMENAKEPITVSKDFYFKQTLYTTSRDGYDAVECTPTEWYKQYLSDFRVALQMTLKENYSYSETLSLTIEQDGFILELV